MNKGELIAKVAAEADVTKVQAERALNAILSGISDSLMRSGAVTLAGFGSFKIALRKARTGLNPRTHEPIEIAAKKLIRFSAGTKLRAAIDKKD